MSGSSATFAVSTESPIPAEAVLALRQLQIELPLQGGAWTPVVKAVSLEIARGERVALVGESGSGKTMTAMAALGLLPGPARQCGGQVLVEGLDLARATPAELRRARGAKIGLIFQEPGTALNPVFSVSFHLCEALRLHRGLRGGRAREEAARLLSEVSLEDPGGLLSAYPHQLSGGQLQRVLLALALACNPLLLIADEPTTDLDVTTRAQVLRLLRRVSDDHGLGLLLITHDLAAVAATVHRVAVMYAGEIVEVASVQELFASPAHPYTQGLLACLPRLGRTSGPAPLRGRVPELGAWGVGCRFAPRCDQARPECSDLHPELEALAGGGLARCPFAGGERAS